MSDGNLTLPVSDRDHSQGKLDAPVTLVEYGDYECPHCGAAYPIVKRLQEQMGKKLRFVFRNFPLNEVHPHALHAAEAAESVAVHAGPEAYWKMHDLIFEHQRDLRDANLGKLAEQAGADPQVVLSDVTANAYKARVRDDFMSGVKSGVNGTPTFFINGVRHDESWDQGTLFLALEAAAKAHR